MGEAFCRCVFYFTNAATIRQLLEVLLKKTKARNGLKKGKKKGEE
jgi:hypothetical protein